MMSRKQFWIRFSIYIMFAVVLPMAFLIWRFELFTKVNSISIGGWGLVAIIFIAVFFIKLVSYTKKGLPPCLLSQLLDGVCKIIIPLVLAAFCTYFLKDLMTQVFQFLCILIVCETVAIISNPFPTWIALNGIERQNNLQQNNIKLILNSLGIIKQEQK